MNFNQNLYICITTAMPNFKEKLLLHTCCGPCSTTALERLCEQYRVTVFYYNPNIAPQEEYIHRKKEAKRLVNEWHEPSNDLSFAEGNYTPEVFYEAVKGLEDEPEGGARCLKCFELRLRETARIARERGFDAFCTTLTVSPHKNAQAINDIGTLIEKEAGGPVYLPSNFKKQNGYKRSIELSGRFNLYRQHYCGCLFSKNTSNEK